jgi:hypothetical protein
MAILQKESLFSRIDMVQFFKPAITSREIAATRQTLRDRQNTLGKIYSDPYLHGQSFRSKLKSKLELLLEALNDAYTFAIASNGNTSLLEKVHASIENSVAEQKRFGILPQLPFGKALQNRLEETERYLHQQSLRNTYSGPKGP